MSWIIQCECDSTDDCSRQFKHPDGDDCNTIDGRCELLVKAGWRPVTVKVLTEERKKDIHILSRGGWICPACAKRYAPQKKKGRK